MGEKSQYGNVSRTNGDTADTNNSLYSSFGAVKVPGENMSDDRTTKSESIFSS
jgi:hypothetical protein